MIRIKNTDLKTVSMTTNGGTFQPTNAATFTLNIEPDGTEPFRLIPGSSVPLGAASTIYTVAATAGNYSVSKDLTVFPAYPDTLILQPSSYSINSSGGEIILTVKASRASGTVSNGIQIVFEAYQIVGGVKTEVGRFKDTIPAFTSGQQAVVKFDTDTRNPVSGTPLTISAAYLTDNGTKKSQSINLTVN